MTTSSAIEIPDGFLPLPMGGNFIEHNGPLYIRQRDGQIQLGFRVLPQHVNPMNILHGGMMASFCDMLLPISVLRSPQSTIGNRFLPTISLQVDYLGPAALGAWVEGEGQLLRSTRSLVFAQGLVRADGQPCVRTSGVFKMGPEFKHPMERPHTTG